MSKAKKAPTKFDRKIRPALTLEARENQLIALSIDRAEQQLLDGTASQTNPIETYSFPMSGKYATKNIDLAVNADVVLTVISGPRLKKKLLLFIIQLMGKYYLWRQ